MTENPRDPNIRCVYHDPQSPRWEWIHILTFSVDLLNKSLHETPYATGVVVGMQGVVSTNRTRWTMPYLPSTSADFCYHTSDGERNRIDPLMD